MAKIEQKEGLDDATNQLLMLKELTKETGVLHEAQALQLRMWSMLAVSHALNFPEIRFGWEDREIEFLFKKLKKKEQPKDFNLRLENMVKWVHWLLGDEYLVRIKDEKGTIYRGMRTKPVSNSSTNKKRTKHEPKLFDGDPE